MKLIEKIKSIIAEIEGLKADNDETRLLIGSMFAQNISAVKTIKDAEFKVFSQFGDDGIIQFLIRNLEPTVDKFVEFGVETYKESNTRFLLMHDNWQGLIIDGSKANIDYIKKTPIFWRYDLTPVNSFITVENINQILEANCFDGKIGLLSIDIDGNDYWIWQAITVSDADIVVIEYNSLFGIERAITVPYIPDFFRGTAHYSCLYFGASLPALYDLAKSKGYAFVGCNKAGNNAYFVKKDLIGPIPELSLREGFVASRFREARDYQGKLTFAKEEIRMKEISGLPVFNTRTGLLESI
ncbi:hypothetical protein GCM10028808_12050 [Spirosoma migulaei]